MEVRIARRADRSLARLPPEARERIEAALPSLKEDPRRPRPGADIKALDPERSYFRLRVGDYRVFYVILQGIVVVVDVRRRRSGTY